jgi:hypothetical protein
MEGLLPHAGDMQGRIRLEQREAQVPDFPPIPQLVVIAATEPLKVLLTENR